MDRSLAAIVPGTLYRCLPDADWTILFVSEAVEALTGYPPGHFAGRADRGFASFILPEDLDAVSRQVREALAAGTPWQVDYRIRHRDGTLRWVRETGHGVTGPDGGTAFLEGFLLDTTESRQAVEQSQKSMADAQSLINGIPDALFVLSREGVFLDYKGDERDMYVRRERFLGRHYREVLPESLWGEIDAAFRRLLATKQPVELAYALPLGGKLQFFSARIVLFGEDKLLVLSRNVTAQKRMEEALRRSREQFELAVQGANDGIWDWNLEENSLYLSPQWKAQIGYRDEELVNAFATFEALLHPDDKPRVLVYLGRYLRGDLEPYQVEFRMRHKDGGWRWILARGAASRTADGIPFRMAGSHTDITERKRVEEEIGRQTRLQQLLMEISSTYIDLPFQRFDAQVQVSFGELAAFVGADRVYLFDYDFGQGISVNTHEWCADGIEPQKEYLQAVPLSATPLWVETHRRGEAVYIPDVAALPPDSGERQVLEPQGIRSVLAVPMMDGDQCLGFVGFDSVREPHRYTDTERRLLTVFARMLVNVRRRLRTEEALKQSQAEAERANRAKSEFLAMMSHEIRNPMNAIIGTADLLWESPLNEDQRQYVRIFRAAGEELLALLNDILDISKMESGLLHLDIKRFDLGELLERVGEVMALRAHDKGLELACRTAPGLPCLLGGDPLRLRQILLNLIGNAVKFTERGEVVVTVEAVGTETPAAGETGEGVWLQFSVRDTGIGIPADKVSAIFDKFTQADTSITRKYGGSGLGLTIARQLVTLMGGRIWVESEVGRGTAFHFTAPFAVHRDDMAEAAVLCRSIDLRNLRILVVDDQATNRLILSDILVDWGATVRGADSAGGLAVFREQRQAGTPFDLLFLADRRDGAGDSPLAEALRQDPELAAITVLTLPSDDQGGGAARARALGAAAHLIKPVKRTDLLAVLEAALDRREAVCAAPAAWAETAEAAEAAPKPAETRRILLVDDSEDNRLLVQAYLKTMPYRVETAENGQVAVEKFRAGAFDLVLMDMQMPVMDGYTATRTIRAWEREQGRPPTPIVALTAYALKEDDGRSLAAGCDAHLTKPIRKTPLLAMIRDLTA